tara:strand:- start:5456 stop:6310 length:855 start_codon:yes stop_codon:yes gene_type:complete
MSSNEKEVELEDGTKVTIYVVKPSNQVISQADIHRAKRWNECIRDNVITKKELKTLMEDRGIWDKSKSDKEDEIGSKISDLEKKLYRGEGGKKPKVSEGKNLALEMRRLRSDLRELISERLGLEENTAEALADNARFDYFVANCTFYKDSGKRVYNSVEDYNKRSSDSVAFTAASMLGNILYNLDSDFEKNLPENKWLNMFNLTDDEGSLVNSEGKTVDSEGRLINEQGHFLDEDGNRVDANGIPLDKDGNYILVDYENDLEPPKKKRTTRKKATTKATDTTES